MADPEPTGGGRETNDQRWLGIVLAIADGTPIDWSAEASAAADADSSNPGLGRKLRQLERLVRGHDELRDSSEPVDPPSPPRFTETDLLEVRWGPLVVREKLGQGSFGDVYRAWDPRIEREVALKIVIESVEAQRPVIDEARRLARVAHPNVLAVYGAERIAGRTGIWMQYVRGRTLDDEVREHGPLAPDDVIRIAIDVARALGAVHAAALVHGDVKARNVLRDTSGRILLCDFGASVDLDDAAPDAAAPTAGTPLYLAPEILNGMPASQAGDFYALGVLLFFLATGTYPVQGRTTSDIRKAHAQGPRATLGAERPALPAGLVSVVDRLLRPEPEERPSSAVEIERDLGGPPAQSSAFWRWASLVSVVTAAAVGVWAWLAVSPTGVSGTHEVVNAPCWSKVSATGWMACASDSGQTQRIVLFRPATNTLQPIHDVTGGLVREAIISPDGRRVAYSLGRPDQTHPNRVRLLDLGTGADRLVAELPADLELASLRAWWPRADALEMFMRRAGNQFTLERLEVASGRLEPVFDFPSMPQGHATSPDGRVLAFDVRAADGSRDIRACRLDDKTCVTVTSNPAEDFRPFWSPAGALFFTSSRGGEYGLWRVTGDVLTSADQPTLVRDLGRNQLWPLGFDANGAFYYDLVGSAFDLSLVRLDQPRGAGATTELERVSGDPTSLDTAPAWSTDGKLAYLEQRGPFSETDAVALVIQSPSGGVERRMPIVARLASSHLAWAPDGRRVAFAGLVGDAVTAGGVPKIRVFDAGTGAERDTFQPQNVNALGWIDDNTVAYALGRGIGEYDVARHVDRAVWVAPPTIRVASVAVSHDGRELAVTAQARDGSGWKIFVIPAAGTTTAVPLMSSDRWIQAQDWMPSGHALLVSVPSATAQAPALDLVARPINGGPDTVLVRGVLGLAKARISADGKRLAVVVQGGIRHEMSTELPK